MSQMLWIALGIKDFQEFWIFMNFSVQSRTGKGRSINNYFKLPDEIAASSVYFNIKNEVLVISFSEDTYFGHIDKSIEEPLMIVKVKTMVFYCILGKDWLH